MEKISPNFYFSEERFFDERYRFNQQYDDFDSLMPVLEEIEAISNIYYCSGQFFRDSNQKPMHPRGLYDYFDTVGIEIHIFRQIDGWKYVVQSEHEVIQKKGEFASRSSAEYVAFIFSLEYRNSQITTKPIFKETTIQKIIGTETYKVNVFGLFDSIVERTLEIDKVHELIRQKLNGIYHSWFLELVDTTMFGSETTENLKLVVMSGINGKLLNRSNEIDFLSKNITIYEN